MRSPGKVRLSARVIAIIAIIAKKLRENYTKIVKILQNYACQKIVKITYTPSSGEPYIKILPFFVA